MSSSRKSGLADHVEYDVAVVGGGVVGCAMARSFTLAGARCILIEAGADILSGASKANSAILHTGFDAPPGSLEHHCMTTGYRQYMELCEQLGLPVLKTGAFVVAWNAEEEAQLDGIERKAHENGVRDARRIGAADLLAREPNLSSRARGAVEVPREYVLDPWTTPLAYVTQHVQNGGTLMRNAPVSAVLRRGGLWHLETPRGVVRAARVINCAGLYGDRLDEMAFPEAGFAIRPRKGQFVVLDKMARELVSSIILPVPTERTKGVVICPTIFGNVLVGPTAQEQESRTDTSTQHEVLKQLIAEARSRVPGLEKVQVNATYAGIRPATEKTEYRIFLRAQGSWTTVGGIRSTGLTAALGIANHVLEMNREAGMPRFRSVANPAVPKLPVLAEHETRDWRRPGHGGIICQCEFVTRREILAALEGPVPARSPEGLKRRTRAGMGRCQGFYCAGKLADLTRDRFEHPVAAPKESRRRPEPVG